MSKNAEEEISLTPWHAVQTLDPTYLHLAISLSSLSVIYPADMDKFIKDLKDTLERSLTDITVLDEYEVDPEFLREMMVHHLQKEKSQVLSLSDIQVFEGPNISSISITLSVRFDLTFLPDYNIEEKKKINIFLKIPIFDQENKTAVKLCNKEIKVYRDFFESLKDHLDHPIKAGLNILPRICLLNISQ